MTLVLRIWEFWILIKVAGTSVSVENYRFFFFSWARFAFRSPNFKFKLVMSVLHPKVLVLFPKLIHSFPIANAGYQHGFLVTWFRLVSFRWWRRWYSGRWWYLINHINICERLQQLCKYSCLSSTSYLSVLRRSVSANRASSNKFLREKKKPCFYLTNLGALPVNFESRSSLCRACLGPSVHSL